MASADSEDSGLQHHTLMRKPKPYRGVGGSPAFGVDFLVKTLDVGMFCGMTVRTTWGP